MKVTYKLFPSLILFLLLFSRCGEDKISQDCGGREVLESFNDKYLRFIITEARPTEAVASFIHLDSASNITTEYQSCVLHDYDKLENMKVIKANGRIFKQTDGDRLKLIQVDNYDFIDYCSPAFEIKVGEFTLENRWDVVSLQTPDTLLYVPCEAYPDGAFITIGNGTLSGFSGVNGFAGKLTVTSSTELQLDNVSLGLIAGTNAQNEFEGFLFECLKSNTTLYYRLEKNTLLIENRINNYSIKLFSL